MRRFIDRVVAVATYFTVVAVALAAADPLLDEAVRAGAISERDRRALRWRIRDGEAV